VTMGRPTLYVARVEDIGPALKDLRRSEDVSQADLSRAIDLHPSHMGTYERSRVIPNSRRLLEIILAHHYVIGFVPRELAL
jgi:transcriptional regulator with XRE-family HTH domain